MRSVHRLSLVLLVLRVAPPLLAQQPPRLPAPVSSGPMATHGTQPNTYGVIAESKLLVAATAFFPWDSAVAYTGISQRFTTTLLDLSSPLHLPSGAKIVSLELDYFDSNATAAEYFSLYVCDYLGNNCTYHPSAGDGPGDCNQVGFICSGTANAPGSGSFHDTLIANDNIVIDNSNNQYHLLAYNSSTNGSTAVASIIVGYILQVSPAPAVAFFNDVPTSDFGFQFVEAFAAAGITVGCTSNPPFPPPVYCPDRNVTRREMAIFFAKALGLQFP